MKWIFRFTMRDLKYHKIVLLPPFYFRFRCELQNGARDMIETRLTNSWAYWYEIHSPTDWETQHKWWLIFRFIRGKWREKKTRGFEWNKNGNQDDTLVQICWFFVCKYFLQSFFKWKMKGSTFNVLTTPKQTTTDWLLFEHHRLNNNSTRDFSSQTPTLANTRYFHLSSLKNLMAFVSFVSHQYSK